MPRLGVGATSDPRAFPYVALFQNRGNGKIGQIALYLIYGS